MPVEPSAAAKLSAAFESHSLAMELDTKSPHGPAMEMGMDLSTDLDVSYPRLHSRL